VRYLIYIDISTEVGNRVDFEEGGPGKIWGYMLNRFKPEAVYAEAGSRNIFVVADLDEAQMQEFKLIASKKLDTYPEFMPYFLPKEFNRRSSRLLYSPLSPAGP
jgi:hypothetical protein